MKGTRHPIREWGKNTMKVRFWTVQKLDVITALLQYGTYQPSFEYSDYAAIIPGLPELYDFLLNSYNHVNGTDLPGLVFAFLEQGEEGIYDFPNYATFVRFIRSHRHALKSMWEHLASLNTVVLCVEKELDFNAMCLDLNDFQYLMPPVRPMPPFPDDYERIVKSALWNGQMIHPIFPSNVLQAHLPDIRQTEVIGIFPMFGLDVPEQSD